MGRKEKKTQDKMRSLLAYVCWYDVRTQTSVVIPVSTDLNLYAHTHSPISRREDRLHLYADGFLEQFPHSLHISFPHLRSSTTHPLNSISNVKRPSFFLYWSFLSPNHTPHPPTPLQFPSSPPTAPSLPPSPLFSVWFCTDGRSSWARPEGEGEKDPCIPNNT